jgi:hypothetical protein
MRSEHRFLVTHTGSLPRPADLTRMMFAKEEGVPVDQAALAARIASAVTEDLCCDGVSLVQDTRRRVALEKKLVTASRACPIS